MTSGTETTAHLRRYSHAPSHAPLSQRPGGYPVMGLAPTPAQLPATAREEPEVCRLSPGGRWIRTIGPEPVITFGWNGRSVSSR